VDECNTKVSIRSGPGYNAAYICETFGGGGHPGAAGASLRMPLNEAMEAVIKAMPEI
jgi:phosphoesterase RecJ-like protein